MMVGDDQARGEVTSGALWKLELLPGMKPTAQYSSKESSSRNVILIPQGKDFLEAEKQPPTGGV